MVYALDISNPNINPLARFSDIASIANIASSLLIIVASLAFVFVMLSGAFTYLTSGGDSEKVKQAQKTLKFAIIGMSVVIVSFLIVKLIEFVLRVDLPL